MELWQCQISSSYSIYFDIIARRPPLWVSSNIISTVLTPDMWFLKHIFHKRFLYWAHINMKTLMYFVLFNRQTNKASVVSVLEDSQRFLDAVSKMVHCFIYIHWLYRHVIVYISARQRTFAEAKGRITSSRVWEDVLVECADNSPHCVGTHDVCGQ